MRRSLWVIPMAFILILTAAVQGNVQAQTPERFFPETKYTVRGAFLQFYEDAPDPLLLFGYPLSDEITGENGVVYQYFQKARFELTAGSDGPAVRLFPLGERLYEQGELLSLPNSARCRRFSNGLKVCFSFLDFYEKYQGEVYLGNPISGYESQDGRMVQYFEFARLEWYRKDGGVGVVNVSQLGRVYMQTFDRSAADAQPPAGIINALSPIALQARAFVAQPLIRVGEEQTIYVIAQDQELKAVANAQVYVTLYYPDGSQTDLKLPSTDANGVSQYPFTVKDVPVKQIVRIEVKITSGVSSADTTTWFRSWW
jgi:hypothetical protein